MESKQETELDGADDGGGESGGIIESLGTMAEGALIFESALATLFRRHRVSVRRAVERGELPAPCRLFGQNAWTAATIIRHLEERQAKAARERVELERRLATLRP